MVKWLTIILAVAGFLLGIWTVSTEREEIRDVSPARPPSINPFANGIAATGLVEPAHRTLIMGVPEPGLVVEVLVNVNDQVQAGQTILRMDDRGLRAELIRAEAARAVALAKVRWFESAPRSEDLPPLRAAVAQALAALRDARDRWDRARRAGAQEAASEREIVQWQYAVETAEANLQVAEANLARAEAGSWSADIDLARADVSRAESDIESLKIQMERLVIRAPADGTVLRRNIDPGEYASGTGDASIILGDLSRLHVRAMVNEEDLALLRAGAKATARARGGSARDIDLVMLWIEPFASPKQQISGRATELVDTRVVEVVFSASGAQPGGGQVSDLPQRPPVDTRTVLYPGQLVDVFIEAAPLVEN